MYSLSVVPCLTPGPTTLYLYALDAQRGREGKHVSADQSSCITLIQAQPHACTLSQTHAYTCTHKHALSHRHTNIHTHAQTCMHTHRHSCTHTHTRILSLIYSFIHLFAMIRKLAAGVLIVGIEVAWKEESCYFLRCGGMGCRCLRERDLGACCQQTHLV